jgi:hypothetical protein
MSLWLRFANFGLAHFSVICIAAWCCILWLSCHALRWSNTLLVLTHSCNWYSASVCFLPICFMAVQCCCWLNEERRWNECYYQFWVAQWRLCSPLTSLWKPIQLQKKFMLWRCHTQISTRNFDLAAYMSSYMLSTKQERKMWRLRLAALAYSSSMASTVETRTENWEESSKVSELAKSWVQRRNGRHVNLVLGFHQWSDEIWTAGCVSNGYSW